MKNYIVDSDCHHRQNNVAHRSWTRVWEVTAEGQEDVTEMVTTGQQCLLFPSVTNCNSKHLRLAEAGTSVPHRREGCGDVALGMVLSLCR